MRRVIERVCKYSKFFGITTAGTVAVIGVILYEKSRRSPIYSAYTPSDDSGAKWDWDWDKREPSSLVKPLKESSTDDEKQQHREKVEKKVSTVTRHLLLIRHGQYHDKEKLDINRTLTELGREQAQFTGQRLADLNYPYSKLICSTMTRARETADIIHKFLPDLPRSECELLREGAPIRPDPPSPHWRPDASQFHKDGARIEAAFRKHFHRAEPDQEHDSYEVVVCHANVIRYFVCRALQFPAEGWLRMSLNHASVTWVYIRPNGRVGIRVLGEAGFMPVDKLSVL